MASVINTARVRTFWRVRRRRMNRMRGIGVAAIFAMLLTGCSVSATSSPLAESVDNESSDEVQGSAQNAPEDAPAPAESDDGATQADTSEVTNEADKADPTDNDEAAPDTETSEAEERGDWANDLVPGVCFDEAPDEESGDLVPGPPIDCDGPHEFEVFHKGQLADRDSAAWPGLQALAEEAFASFCDEELIPFAGRTWDLLPLETFAWVPDEADWSEGSRSAVCTVASIVEGAKLTGTAAGSGLAPSSTDFIISMVVGTHGGLEIAVAGTNSEFASITAQDLGLYDDALAFDGDRSLWFVADPDNDGSRALMRMDLGTNQVFRIDAFDGRDVWNPASDGNGTVIVSAGFDGAGDTELWTVGAEGAASQITDTPGIRVDHPALAPGSTHVVFSAAEDGVAGSTLWRFDFEGELTQLTEGSAEDTEPAVAADGTQIVFTSDRSGNLDVWSIEPDGSNLTNLTNHPSRDSQAAYSLETDRIFFQSDRFGQTDNTMFMLRDGSEQGSVTFDGVRSPEVVPLDSGVLIYSAAFNNQLAFCPVPGGDGTADCFPLPDRELVAVTTNPEPPRAPWPGEDVLAERVIEDCGAALDERFGTERKPREVFPVLISEEVWDFGTRTTACMLALDQ